jgi:hypothetical protein
VRLQVTKKVTSPLPTTDSIFYAGTGMLLCRSEDKVRALGAAPAVLLPAMLLDRFRQAYRAQVYQGSCLVAFRWTGTITLPVMASACICYHISATRKAYLSSFLLRV